MVSKVANKRLNQLVKNKSMTQSPILVGKALNQWKKYFPREQKFFNRYATKLNRLNISKFCLSQGATNIDKKFLLVMLWGYGSSSVGAFRTKEITKQPNFDKKLQTVFKLSNNGQNIDAFSYLALNQIKGFGPAFASKFIFFCTPKKKNCAPIYDSRVRKWLIKNARADFTGINLNQASWNTNSYSAWCQWLNDQAKILGVNWADLEYLIFQDSQQVRNR